MLLRSILRDGEDRLYLLALLNRQCRQLLSAARLAQKRQPPAVIAQQTGIPAFAVQRTLAQARLYSMEQLKEMTSACLETEYRVKSGQLMDEGALEKLMLTILSYREGKK
jgi:DNA polymerase-3 subunit delta